MSDDWAEKHIGVHKQKQQEQQNRQTRVSLAQGGASDMFQRIRKRIQHDIQTFHDGSILQSLTLKGDSPGKFVVSSLFPLVRMEVELNIVLIQYQYGFGGQDKRADYHPGTLRICSDLGGVLTVYRNGTEEAFADESEVSEFLLRPMLDYIEK